ncbi:hypothetical protein V474_14585 [Novosphingobium barchaimii LL02]|uniref:Uncharacterized protein n=1 Tax=Novosphingobium barchaimii LL02 TaxID=1114963 RepID=A0A0J7XY91_9SPHN|nr:hypothetical protein V474_14585 [Novosphingobium barchaimii LL02]
MSALAFGGHNASDGQNVEVARQCVFRDTEGTGDLASREPIRSGMDEEIDRRQTRILSKRSQCRDD